MHRLRLVLFFLTLSHLVVSLHALQTTQPQQQPDKTAFTEKTASDLLLRMSETLEAHSQKKFLALFDLARMKSGGVFQQQVSLFFTQTVSIRVHMNLVEVGVENERATMSVDAELDAQPIDAPAWHRSERVTFTVANAGGSWKFVDAQPRSFFSLP